MTTLLRKFTIMIMLAVAALSVSAQTGVGNWVIHPVFAENTILPTATCSTTTKKPMKTTICRATTSSTM